MRKCLNCNNDTNNPKFCSMSCAAIFNNKLYPKIKRTRKCKVCKVFIKSKRYCENCRFSGKDMTLKEAIYGSLNRSNAFSLVRTRARAIIRKLDINSCQKCGYNKHVEVCHIKPIADFDESTLVSIINDISNLMVLCPNCHWEFDHFEYEIQESSLSATS